MLVRISGSVKGLNSESDVIVAVTTEEDEEVFLDSLLFPDCAFRFLPEDSVVVAMMDLASVAKTRGFVLFCFVLLCFDAVEIGMSGN